MTSVKFELEADVRGDVGKGASRRLRHTNKIPGIVYGANEPAVSLVLDHDKVKNAVAVEAFYTRILSLKIGNKSEKVILKAMQRHPAKPRILHMDFLRIRADQKLTMNIPLHFLGEKLPPPGVKEGGVINHLMSDVEVSCLPDDLPEYIEVDVSNLGMNESIHLSQVKLPKGVDLVAFSHGVEGHDLQVVAIHMPRVEEEPVAAAPVEGAAVEGAEKAAGDAAAAPAEGAAAPAADKSKDKGKE